MKYRSEVIKNQVGKMYKIYLVIARRDTSERSFKQAIKVLKLDCRFCE